MTGSESVASEPTLREATKVVLRNGFTPVRTDRYRRLRAWLDEQGWPPPEWEPSAIIARSSDAD